MARHTAPGGEQSFDCFTSSRAPRGYLTDTSQAPHGHLTGCTKWLPRVYQIGTTGVPSGYDGYTKWIPKCTKCAPRVYQIGTTGVPNGYHGCTK